MNAETIIEAVCVGFFLLIPIWMARIPIPAGAMLALQCTERIRLTLMNATPPETLLILPHNVDVLAPAGEKTLTNHRDD